VNATPPPDAERLRGAVLPGGREVAQKGGLVLLSGLLYSIAIASVGVASRHISPLTLTAIRLIIASAVLGVILALTRPPFRRRRRFVLDIFIVGLGNVGLPFLLLAVSMRYISSSLAAILFNVGPPLTLLLAHFTLRDERLTRGKVIGTVVAVAGAVLLVGSNATGLATDGGRGWLGQLCIVLASVAGAAALVYTRRYLRNEDTLVLTAGQVFASLVIFLPAMLIVEGIPRLAGLPGEAWSATVASAISAPVLAFFLLFYIVKKYSASLGGFSSIATPLFSAAIGILFLGEVITLPIAAGTILLLAGIWSLNSA
jgi:drug/metabolite transporter (DMT)-like permease